MNKSDQTALGTDPRRFVDQPHSLCLEFRERSLDIIDLDRDVMNAAAAFLEKLADRRIVARRFEQFDPAFADRQHRDPNLLIFDDFGVNILKPESVPQNFRASSMPFVAMPR